MTVHLEIETWSDLSPEQLMERSLDIDLHLSSMADSDERAVGGVTSGLITLGEEVSWRARHLGIWWSMTSRITVLEPGRRFVDEQVRGPFKRFRHEHRFDAVDGRTRMVDTIDFDAPFGPLGSVAERLVLARYLERLIRTRNEHLLQG
ncbi:SRPBCC family protein [Nocardioides jishulii]|nr:SRPBCC family protein [Nocardioides jishulii]